MAKYKFSAAERYAIYTTHSEKCYLCGEPIDLKSMHVDHIIPEELLSNKPLLETHLRLFGLPKNFGINTFSNWMPSCSPCNQRKSSTIFNSTPIVQLELQKAIAKADKAYELAKKTVNKATIIKALNTLERANENGDLNQETIELLKPLIRFHLEERNPELLDEPIKLAPLYEVISEKNSIRTVKGPYGIGSGPIQPNVNGDFICSTCGSTAWNGARCVICGTMNDD